MSVETDTEVRELLSKRTVAVVGCSATQGKDAHEIPNYLKGRGDEIISVNPNADEVLGLSAYDSISEVEERIDIVDVFRPSPEVAGIVDEVLSRDDVEVV